MCHRMRSPRVQGLRMLLRLPGTGRASGECASVFVGSRRENIYLTSSSSPVVPPPLWHACRTALTSVASSTTTATHTRDVLLTSSTLCRTCGSATREPHCVVSYITRRSICLSRCLSLSLQYLCRAWQTMPWMSLIKWGCLILCPSVSLPIPSLQPSAMANGAMPTLVPPDCVNVIWSCPCAWGDTIVRGTGTSARPVHGDCCRTLSWTFEGCGFPVQTWRHIYVLRLTSLHLSRPPFNLLC